MSSLCFLNWMHFILLAEPYWSEMSSVTIRKKKTSDIFGLNVISADSSNHTSWELYFILSGQRDLSSDHTAKTEIQTSLYVLFLLK